MSRDVSFFFFFKHSFVYNLFRDCHTTQGTIGTSSQFGFCDFKKKKARPRIVLHPLRSFSSSFNNNHHPSTFDRKRIMHIIKIFDV